MGSIGILEITLIFLLIILIYGGKKLPELARGLGLGLKEFKKASRLIELDGSIYSGPDSAYRCYTYSDSIKWNAHRWYVNNRSFQRLSDHGYNFIAKHRPEMFKLTKLLFGPNPTDFKPYWVFYILAIILLVFAVFQ